MGKEKTIKVKKEKVFTRMEAERALSAGADPEKFIKHPNYHCRAKAWKLLGKPQMGNADEHAKFLADIRVKEATAEQNN